MKRYLVLKEEGSDEIYTWDSKQEKMFLSVDEDPSTEVQFNLVSLSKFRPLIEVVDEFDQLPKGFSVSDPSEERASRMMKE